jgi:cytochrome P450
MAMATAFAPSVPPHVPPELVRSFPFSFGASTTEIPFDRMVAQVHEGPEIFYVPELYAGGEGGWIPRREEDMRAIYSDPEHFSNQNTTPFPILTQSTWRVLPLESDPPLHSAYRTFLNPVFSPRVTNQLEAKIRDYARGFVAGFKDRGHIDFLQDFAFEFPIKVFLELMGLPQSQVKQFLAWVSDLLHAPDVQTLVRATHEVIGYLRSEIEERKRNPRDDLVTRGIQARIEDGRALTDDEVLGFCFNLFLGGLDTVSTNLTWQFCHLARHAEHQQQLRAHPEMIADAIDEFMRAFAAVMTFRVCVKEARIRGVIIKPGDKVAMSTTLAARDPEAYDRPNEILLNRKPRHVSFGYGPHLCVGMHLARREMKIAMEEFLAAIPQFRLTPGVTMTTALHGVIQPDKLMLEWDV